RNTNPAYLEKFFPVSIHLAAPESEMLGRLFRRRLLEIVEKWAPHGNELKKLNELLDVLWKDALSSVCTNFRKAGLLLNAIELTAKSVAGEVDVFDLAGIETVRRFFPDVYQLIKSSGNVLTESNPSWGKRDYLGDPQKKENSAATLKSITAAAGACPQPQAADAILRLLFPNYLQSISQGSTIYSFLRPASEEVSEQEKRISNSDHFSTYFRSSVPEEMFSNAELERAVENLSDCKSEGEVDNNFSKLLEDMPANTPKRNDFLWKLSRAVPRLDDQIAEWLAFSSSRHAIDYAYDMMNIGEAARALNIVFEAAQKVSSNSRVQDVLSGSMMRATDDTFAIRILIYTEDKGRNKVLTNHANVKPEAIKTAFAERMRRRYGSSVDAATVNAKQLDWWAFGNWLRSSPEDQAIEQDFWRRFVGGSRKRLAQATNFLYPANVAWNGNPNEIVTTYFPLEEIDSLLQRLPDTEILDEIETKGIERIQGLISGIYETSPFSNE
ncbi:MAG: P-loop domain protein, partial [Candidatus Angelobacter sp.]|nr:P-loop domain protein [Candidatus Angelobacter sp.]